MILEVAEIRIEAGQQAAFEAALHEGVRQVLSSARGFLSYLLLIEWQTLENHAVNFRGGPLFSA